MNENPLRSLVCLGILVLICSLAIIAEPCSATEVWSEDFDGDFPQDGWVIDAHTIVVDGTLRGSDAQEVHRPCNLTCGTWSLDILDIGGWSSDFQPAMYVYFMSSYPETAERTFYCLRLTQGTTSTGMKYIYALTKMDGEATVTLASGDGMEGPDLSGTLHHIKVTRTAAGHMSVYVNGTLMVEATDNDISTSECFRLIFHRDYAIDNIVVDDEFDSGVSWELLAIGGGVAGVVLVTVVLVKRR